MARIALVIFLILRQLSICSSNEIDTLLNKLDHTISEYNIYSGLRESRIDGLKNILKEDQLSNEQKYNLQNLLYKEYISYSQDSALHYLNLNLEIAESIQNKDWICETKLRISYQLTNIGSYKEAFDILNSIHVKQLNPSLKSYYYTCCEHIYSELSYYATMKDNIIHYRALSQLYKDSLLQTLDPQSKEYLTIQEAQLLEEGKIEEAEKINTSLFETTKEGTPEYAFISFRRAIINRTKGNKTLYQKYLIVSAISDIKAAVKNSASITLLAFQLYEKNEIEKAYNYIQFSLDNAKFYNARLRLVEVSNILPLINTSYQIKRIQEKEKLIKYLVIISILSFLLLFTMFLLFKQLRKIAFTRNELQVANNQLTTLNSDLKKVNSQLNDLNTELTEANIIKEQYIGQFFSICSSYIDKLDSFRKKVNKQIGIGKSAELFENTKSNEIIEKELKEFHDNFDHTFLNIFPNFVESFNALLLEEEKIQVKKGELLNTELRIYALIRLGIMDSSKIASLLRYSVSTIYNYRFKLKNKSSVPRDDFENYVMKIESSSKNKIQL